MSISKGKDIGQKNRNEIGHMSSFLLESFRGLTTILQYHMGHKQKTKKKDDRYE